MKTKTISNYNTNKLSISNFTILMSGYGHWEVTFRSSNTGKKWSCITNDSQLIDEVRSENPPQRAFVALRNLCKYHRYRY